MYIPKRHRILVWKSCAPAQYTNSARQYLTIRDTKHTTGRVIENVMSVDFISSTHKLLHRIWFVYCIIMYYYLKLSYLYRLINHTQMCWIVSNLYKTSVPDRQGVEVEEVDVSPPWIRDTCCIVTSSNCPVAKKAINTSMASFIPPRETSKH